MVTIWGVSSGEYSDYQVVAIFTSEEKAEVFLAEYRRLQCDARLQEFDLDPEPPDVIIGIQVSIFRNGSILNMRGPKEFDRSRVGFGAYFRGDAAMSWLVETSAAERAIKVANEKRGQLVAANVWGDDDKTQKLLGKE